MAKICEDHYNHTSQNEDKSRSEKGQSSYRQSSSSESLWPSSESTEVEHVLLIKRKLSFYTLYTDPESMDSMDSGLYSRIYGLEVKDNHIN